MDIQESSQHDISFEKDHWWIRSRFRVIDMALVQFENKPVSILEIGCGTGVNLAYLQQKHGPSIRRLVGVDPTVNPARSHFAGIQTEVPKGERFDLILAMDVLEHVEDPVAFLSEVRSFLQPGGMLLVTVPAFQWLWSKHDEMLGHRKRYSLRELEAELKQGGFRSGEGFYLFAGLFPVFICRRVWTRFFPGLVHATLEPHSRPINWFFYHLTKFELWAVSKHNRWFGSSLACLSSVA